MKVPGPFNDYCIIEADRVTIPSRATFRAWYLGEIQQIIKTPDTRERDEV